MNRNPSSSEGGAVIPPADARTFEGFRRWTADGSFPEKGRIDYLAGRIEMDLSPEDLYTHGTAKTALAAGLYEQIVRTGRGAVFVDCTRLVSVGAQLSVEPDVVVVLWDSLAAGRVREVPAASQKEGRFIELEGAPDLVVEVISDSSARKDRKRLPPLYARAGLAELWLADLRERNEELSILLLEPGGYASAPTSRVAGTLWCTSPLLGRRCRLRRLDPGRGLGRCNYELETHAETGDWVREVGGNRGARPNRLSRPSPGQSSRSCQSSPIGALTVEGRAL